MADISTSRSAATRLADEPGHGYHRALPSG